MKAQGQAVILGGGPAGLACAYELGRCGRPSTVIEANARVGGLCRTINFEGYLFDIGGHRFLSKSEEVNQLWRDILGPELLERDRVSRIFYKGRYFDYPLRMLNALKGLGIPESMLCFLSYTYAKLFSRADEKHLEGWMIRRFGRRLYEIFFKNYTEKVWGVPCIRLSSDWAVQRIQKLSLSSAIRGSLSFGKGDGLKTLSRKFFYPASGPGLFCEKLKERSEALGARYWLRSMVEEVVTEAGKIVAVKVKKQDGAEAVIEGEAFFSSLPLPRLAQIMRPEPPHEVFSASQRLWFRSFISVNLIFDVEHLFPDNWIYINSPNVYVGRLQNYKNWSARMVPDPATTSLGMEYFVSSGDHIWNLYDEEMIEFALQELETIGIVSRDKFVKGFVVRVPNAYPVYEPGYQEATACIRSFLDSFKNLQVMGRAGLFRYNNSDHALLTGLYAARNMSGGAYDLWAVNTDEAYQENYD